MLLQDRERQCLSTIEAPTAKLPSLDDVPDRTVQIGGQLLKAKIEKALLRLHTTSPDPGYASKFGMERANMQPGSAERHAGVDNPGAELIEKFAIARNKTAVLRQPFRKAIRSIC
jgi:hypothetical protein